MARERFTRETARSECLQHGHPCVRSESSCGQPCEGIGFTPDQRTGAAIVVRATGRRGRAPERSSDLCGGANIDVSGNRSVEVGFGAQVTRAAGVASPFGKLGGAVALLFGCPVWDSGFCPGNRVEMQLPHGAPCSEVGAGASGNRFDGSNLMVPATHA